MKSRRLCPQCNSPMATYLTTADGAAIRRSIKCLNSECGYRLRTKSICIEVQERKPGMTRFRVISKILLPDTSTTISSTDEASCTMPDSPLA